MDVLSPELALVDDELARAARAALPPAPDVFAAAAGRRESEPVRRLRAALAVEPVPERRRSRRPSLRLLAGGLALVAIGGGAFAAAARPQHAHEAARAPLADLRQPAVEHVTRTTAASAPARPHRSPTARKAAPPRREPAVVRHAPVARHAPVQKLALKPAPRHAAPAQPKAPSVGKAVSKPSPAPAPTAHTPVLTWAAVSQATHYRVGLFHDGDPPTLVCEVWTNDARLALSAVNVPASRPLTPGRYRWVVYPVYGGDGSVGSGETADTQLAQGTFTL